MGKSRTGHDKPKESTREDQTPVRLPRPEGLSVSVRWAKFTDYVTINGMPSKIIVLNEGLETTMWLTKEPLGNLVLLIEFGGYLTKIPYHNVRGYI